MCLFVLVLYRACVLGINAKAYHTYRDEDMNGKLARPLPACNVGNACKLELMKGLPVIPRHRPHGARPMRGKGSSAQGGPLEFWLA